MRRFTIEEIYATPEGILAGCTRELVSFIAANYEVSKTEAKTMATIVVTAITQKLLTTGICKMPFGDLKFVSMPKQQYPLRVKLYTKYQISKFLNEGVVKFPVAMQACMRPEHYEALSILQDKAYAYKELKNKEYDDEIQKNSSGELQVD